MSDQVWNPHCPVPTASDDERITLAHGEGGRLARRLIEQRIVPKLFNATLARLGDAALLPRSEYPLAFTADSFVVSPLFFPGGNIGTLAVFGTANDLAVAGARPRWLSLSFILEEGLPFDVFDQVLTSIAKAAARIDVQIVTGDTKVVPRGAADRMFIQTTGIGELVDPPPLGPSALVPGDELLVSGPIGRHGIAVLSAREGLAVEPAPVSDCGPLLAAVDSLRTAGVNVRAMRDATRGGVAAVLHEWAQASRTMLAIDERQVPVTPDVRGICELLGLDPLHVANEGTMVVAIEPGEADKALAALRQHTSFTQAARIGTVEPAGLAPVVVRRALGRAQPLDEPLGAPLPRIC
ncbi:MAG TPA: hydrogenase expression/formation protein HypE [Pirellulales bacterium]|nr:hydrogenase expression/formation protein HypE [Pirellulales bacterium]